MLFCVDVVDFVEVDDVAEPGADELDVVVSWLEPSSDSEGFCADSEGAGDLYQ